MSWWEILILIAVMILAIWGFASMVGLQTRNLSRRSTRTAQDLYGRYADSPRRQRRYAREHGGEWQDDE